MKFFLLVTLVSHFVMFTTDPVPCRVSISKSQDFIEVNCDGDELCSDSVTMTIYNVVGRNLRRVELPLGEGTANTELRTSDLPNGIYLVRCELFRDNQPISITTHRISVYNAIP